MKTAAIVTRIKCGLVLFTFMLILIFPVTSTIGLFVVIFRPKWSKQLVDTVYADKSDH
jgi:ABC-type dipeptide/oligopeptide/nickel transport system permease component